MASFDVRITKKPDVKRPILIEGLPGVGHVGRIAALHLSKELKAVKFADIYSDSFPPQVLIDEDGSIQVMKNELYYWKAEKENQRDIIFAIGNTQSTTPDGQYGLSEKILDIASEYGVDMVYTLGGFGVGRIVEKPRVYGAVTHRQLLPELEKLKVIIKRNAVGQIIGVSGLLLGLAKLRGTKGICLMGETSGYYLDPNSAKAVLDVLLKLINVDVDTAKLAVDAKDAEKKLVEAQKIERKMMEDLGVIQREPSDDQMRYIG